MRYKLYRRGEPHMAIILSWNGTAEELKMAMASSLGCQPSDLVAEAV